jgi:hypothetical protein
MEGRKSHGIRSLTVAREDPKEPSKGCT